MIRIWLTAVLLGLAATTASAQAPYPYPGAYPYWGVYPDPYFQPGPRPGRRPFGAPTGYCQRLCVQDQSPCDPPEFKRADGRCNNPSGRVF